MTSRTIGSRWRRSRAGVTAAGLFSFALFATYHAPSPAVAQVPPPCTGAGGTLVNDALNGCGGYGGGAAQNTTASTGGESSPTGAGLVGQNAQGGTRSGGGGGGSGSIGGAGGNSAAGGLGGAGATVTGGNGSSGANGGGGGGGAHSLVITSGTTNSMVLQGGSGGSGAAGVSAGAGGGGGAGGYGLVVNGPNLTVINNASITGGNGGVGGGAVSSTVGEGGDGGHGVDFLNGGVATNSSTISGGAGGNSGTASSNQNAFPEGGNGGSGVSFRNGGTLLTNSAAGTISGGNGGNASAGTNSLAGNGGAGVTGLNVGIANDGTIQGGNGGNGGRGGLGQGAKGGDGVVFGMGASVTITNNGTIRGGNGGSGRAGIAAAVPASGAGDGGVGISASSLTIMNISGASITGGDGGAATASGAAGAGGVGITGVGLRVITGGTISGGIATASVRANAITFTGESNYLELQSGYVVNGNAVDQTGAGTFALGGDTSPAGAFIVNNIGPAAQFQGFSSFLKTGTSIWELAGASAATTPWTIEQGTLAITDDQNLGAASGVLTFASNGLAPRPVLRFDALGVTLDRPVALTTTGTFDTFGNTAAISGLVSGNGVLVKTGDGTLVLNGANTYAGGTRITQGTVAISSDQNLGATSGGLVFASNSLGTIPTLQFLADVTSGRSVTLVSAATFDTVGNDTTLAGEISGDGTLIKTGTGTLTLTAENTYGGNTTISAGTLQLGNGGGTGSILGDVSNSGLLVFNRSNTLDFEGTISGTGAVAQIGEGTTVLTGVNNYSGTTTVSAGALQAGAVNTFSPNSAHMVQSEGRLDLAGFDQIVPSLQNAGIARTGGQAHTNLTVRGDYIGLGGILNLNTYLAGDGAPSDRLVINGGTATGLTRLVIDNVGGPGSVTNGNGILVVDAISGGTTQTGAFALDAPAVAGPYEYLLYRSSLDGSGLENWYLRSEAEPASPGPDPTPIPLYRQEDSLYAAIPPMAAIYGRNLVDTLHERVGEEEQLSGDLSDETNFSGVWGRSVGQWGHSDGAPSGIYGGAPEFDYRFGALQFGMDLYRDEQEDGTRDHAGLYLAYGQGDTDVTHNVVNRTFDAGTNRFNAFSIGGYWTRFGENGWYVDGVLQGTWYDVTTHSHRTTRFGFPDQDVDGFGFAASLESGYPFDLGSGWQLEPQAQVVWQTINFDDFNDGAADIRYDNLNSLAGRIGTRVAHTWQVEEVTATEPAKLATVWGRVNLWHEFTAKAKTEISSADGFVPFSTDLDETWVEFGIGGTRQVSKNASLYGNVNFSTTFDADNYAWTGKLGVRVNW